MVDLTVVILTYNEEKHLLRAIDSVRPFASRVIIVDSYSTDRTKQIAIDANVDVFFNKFINQSQQFNWALDSCQISSKWIMRLDADEVISDELSKEILAKVPDLDTSVVGINLKRRHVFLKKWIRFGGRYPLWMLRIWRNGHGRVEDRWMDEHVVVSGGHIVYFKEDFSDHNLNDITYFTDKHNKYATREAIEVLNQKYHFLNVDQSVEKGGASFQAKIKRFIKEKVFNRIPFYISSFLYFIIRYFFQLGFLDGVAGVIYHFLQGFWYRFLVGSKVYELSQLIAGDSDPVKIRKKLEKATGLQLNNFK